MKRITEDVGLLLLTVRYDLPSGAAVTTLATDLAVGRLDRASNAVCSSTR